MDLGIPGLRDFKRIGAGGSASVFRARTDDGGIVAVKLLKWSLGTAEAKIQFERELQALDLLEDHPGIVSVLDSGVTDRGEPYLVMPMLVQSAQSLLQSGPLPWREAAELTAEAADAIEFAHTNGLIHRDIKPANILIDDKGNPKIADFGVAKIVDITQPTSSEVVATPSFIAPERYSGGPATEKGDVYSLAATLWNLVTGDAPFTQGDDVSPLTIMRRSLDDKLTSLTDYGASPAVAGVVAEALAKDPEARPDSAAEFASSLRLALVDESTETMETSQPGRRGMVAATLVLAVAAIGLLSWLGLRDDPASTVASATDESTATLTDESTATLTDADAADTAAGECRVAGEAVDTTVSAGECDALVSFYEATGGENWVNTEGWMTASDPCTWFGIKCENGSIMKLDLRENGVTGPIPTSIVGLSKLKQFVMFENQLTGEVPVALTELPELWYLALAGNDLSGPIPSELSRLEKLRSLHLQHNSFTGQIPPELGGLSSLEEIYLTDNGLTGTLPATFGGLTNLVKLDAGANQLSGPVPTEIGNLEQLAVLGLSVNEFTSLPSSIGNLTRLVDLKLAGNQFQSVPSEVGNLIDLNLINLDNNQVAELPPEIGNLTNLARLHFAGNSLTSLPDELGNLTALTQLDLRDNVLRGDVSAALRGAARPESSVTLADGPVGNECLIAADEVAAWLDANDPGWDEC